MTISDNSFFDSLLLTLLATGFFQALVGLDAADGNTDSVDIVVNSLLQAMLGSAQFDLYTDSKAPNFPFNAILYYSWSALVIILLLNILIALFGSVSLLERFAHSVLVD